MDCEIKLLKTQLIHVCLQFMLLIKNVILSAVCHPLVINVIICAIMCNITLRPPEAFWPKFTSVWHLCYQLFHSTQHLLVSESSSQNIRSFRHQRSSESVQLGHKYPAALINERRFLWNDLWSDRWCFWDLPRKDGICPQVCREPPASFKDVHRRFVCQELLITSLR